METLFQVLYIINYICIAITTVGFLFQLIYIFFIWLKPKHFPKSEVKKKFAIVICGRNEGSVIAETVHKLLNEQTYPKELYDVFVCAHNCTDNTYEEAIKAGAIAYKYDDLTPSHMRVAYPLKFLLDTIVEKHGHYDAFIRFDADNLCKPDYIERMNDALNAGAKIARPFEWSKNANQNVWTKVSATYYVRDSRIPSNFRERVGMSSMLTGAGMMVSFDVYKEKGWDAMGLSEDAEYTLNRMIDGHKVHFVADAVVLEDQPSTFVDNMNRLKRMGCGLNRLFFAKGFKFVGQFFKRFKFTYIDLFMQLFFIPVGVLCCLWFPLYYAFLIISHLVNAFHPFLPYPMTSDYSLVFLWETGILIGYILGAFVVVYTFQTWLALAFSKKHLGLKSFKGLYTGIFLSSFFMILWAIGITLGALSKPKWKQIRRNVQPKTDVKVKK